MDDVSKAIDSSTLPNFQSDEAINTDFFGSHQRVATAISKVINSHSHATKTIGLLGSWGSGKSTITKIVEKLITEKLSDQSQRLFFYYDAWLHQNDGPRRSFIESFVAFLEARLPDVKGRWTQDIDRLSRRLEETEKTTTPTLSFAGRWIALSLLPAAWGWKLADKSDGKIWGTDYSVQYLGFLLIGLPALAALSCYLRSVYRKESHESILSIFVNKAVSKESTKTIRTPEPTAVEFQKLFNKILGEVAKHGRSFVIVVDNLDRISEAEAVAIWATIRSFFIDEAAGSIDQPNKTSPLTVLLPLDISAIKRMYGGKNTDASDELAQSFIDKTFDLVFYVNPPTQSGWHDYMERQLSLTMPKLQDNDIFSVVHAYEQFLQISGKGVTPRNINALVAQLGILHLQWQNKIPMSTLVHYALYRDKIAPNVAAYLTNDHSQPARLDRMYAENISAIHFGVEPEEALQVLLLPKIQSALSRGDGEDFQALGKIKGFEAVLLSTVEQSISDDESALEFSSTTAALLAAVPFSNAARHQEIMQRLKSAFYRPDSTMQLHELTPSGIEALLNSADDAEKARLADAISMALEKAVLTADESASATLWANCLRKLTAGLKEWDTKKTIRIPGSSSFFIRVVDALKADELALTLVATAVPVGDISKLLADSAKAAKFVGDFSGRIAKCQKTKVALDYSAIFDEAISTIEQVDPENSSYLPAIDVVGHLRKSVGSSVFKEKINTLSGGYLLDRYYNKGKPADAEITSANLTLLILNNPTFAVNIAIGEAQNGSNSLAGFDEILKDDALVAAADRRLQRYGPFKDFQAAAAANKQVARLFSVVVSKRISENRIQMHLEDVVRRFSNYADLLQPDVRVTFAATITSGDGFWKTLEEQRQNPDTAALLALLADRADEVGRDCRNIILDDANELNEEAWGQFIHYKLKLAGAIRKAAKNDARFRFGEALEKAIKVEIDQGLTNADRLAQLENAFEAANLLEAARYEVLAKGIRDTLVSGISYSGMWNILRAGGTALIASGHFHEKSDESIRHLIVPMLDNIKEFLPWLENNQQAIRQWKGQSAASTKEVVREKIRALAGNETSDEVRRVAAALKVRLRENVSAKPEIDDASS